MKTDFGLIDSFINLLAKSLTPKEETKRKSSYLGKTNENIRNLDSRKFSKPISSERKSRKESRETMKRAKSEKFQTKLTEKASLAHKNLQNRKLVIQKVHQFFFLI